MSPSQAQVSRNAYKWNGATREEPLEPPWEDPSVPYGQGC